MSNFTEFITSKSIEKIALIDDQRSISYNELAVSVRQHVSYLKSIGIRSGDKIVIALPDSIEWCIAFLSCFLDVTYKLILDKLFIRVLHSYLILLLCGAYHL